MSIHTRISVSHPALQGFLNNHYELDILFIIESGSALWGLKNELSDTDFLGVYLPDIADCILGTVRHTIQHNTNPHVKNTPDDIDIKIHSIHHFLKNSLKGDPDTAAVLFSPQDNFMFQDGRFKILKSFRSRLINQRMITSARGGAMGRYSEWEKRKDPKMLYHGCRFLWIARELITHQKVRLPLDPIIRERLLHAKKDPDFALFLYKQLNKSLDFLRVHNRLPLIGSSLTNSLLLALYNSSISGDTLWLRR